MQPHLIKHLNRLAECRPDVTAIVAHLWELPTNEPADPIGWVGFSCSRPRGESVTLATFCTNASVPVDDRRLSRDLSAFNVDWLVDNLAKLAESKPWNGGVKRHQWPSWDYLFLDGWCSQPVELTFPARWKPVEVVVPPRLLIACGDRVLVKPDGWFVEINNVLPRLADLVRADVGEQTATVATRPGRNWKDGPPPAGWHPDYIEGKLEELVRVAGVRDKKTLLRYNGKSWWIWKRSGRQFRLYARNASEYAHWKRKWLTSVKADEKG